MHKVEHEARGLFEVHCCSELAARATKLQWLQALQAGEKVYANSGSASVYTQL